MEELHRQIDEEIKKLLGEENQYLSNLFKDVVNDYAYLWRHIEDLSKIRQLLIAIVKLFLKEHPRLIGLSEYEKKKFKWEFEELVTSPKALLAKSGRLQIREIEGLTPHKWFIEFRKTILDIAHLIAQKSKFSPETGRPVGLKILKVPFYLQGHNECGPTCMKMVLEFFGLNIDLERIKELSVFREFGTSETGMARCAALLGFRVECYYETLSLDDSVFLKTPHFQRFPEQIKEYRERIIQLRNECKTLGVEFYEKFLDTEKVLERIGENCLAIASLNWGRVMNVDELYEHFVVVVGYNSDKSLIFVNNPEEKPFAKISMPVFNRARHHLDNLMDSNMIIISKKSVPLGLGAKLEAGKQTLPAVRVKNEVYWVNPNLDLPFKLEKGQPADLGVFLSSQIEKFEDRPGSFLGFSLAKEKSMKLGVKPKHGRSALLPRILFGGSHNHNQNNVKKIYRDIDIKGGGLATTISEHGRHGKQMRVGEIETVSIPLTSEKRTQGILDLASANHDAKVAEQFHEFGIRTHRVAAIILLEEIISSGKRISILEAKQKKIIPENITPVLELRAFGTHNRLTDTYIQSPNESNEEREKKNLMIEDARLLVSQELGVDPKIFDRLEYAKYISKIVGENLYLMHKNFWVHNYLSAGHNITLDGCFVDFDSAEQVGPENPKYKTDSYDAVHALYDFLNRGLGFEPEVCKTILKEFYSSYKLNWNV